MDIPYFSDAIRQGCVGTYKVKHTITDTKGGWCVVGAALAALHTGVDGTVDRMSIIFGPMPSAWRWLQRPPLRSTRVAESYWDHYVHLNNDTELAREAIADLVELDEWELGVRQPVIDQPTTEVLVLDATVDGCPTR